MPPALWTLIWLNARAIIRKIGRQMRSVRGIVFFCIGLLVLAAWLGPSLFANARFPKPDPAKAMAAAPAAILVFCLVNILTSVGERAVTFTPAEVDFLFPGPFSRRQLLIYKLTKTALAGSFSAIIFGIVLGRLGGSFPCRAIGSWLLFQFFQLLAMVYAMVQTTIGEQLFAAGRRWILTALGIAVALAGLEVFLIHHSFSPALLLQARDTTAGRIVLAPFKIFAHALLADRFLFEGLRWSAIAAAIDLLMAVIVIGLDANFLENSAAISARRYDRLARVRRSGLAGMARASSGRLKLPLPPALAGTGPIIWRQLTTALRTARTLLTILFLLAIGAGAAGSQDNSGSASIGLIIGMSICLNLFLSDLLKFDFRGDLDHLDVLRSLPLRPTAIAAAQLVAPVVILSIFELVLLITIAFLGRLPAVYLIGVGIFAIPVIILALGIDNLLFLLFPFRASAAVAGDMAMVGRRTIVLACRSGLVLLVAGIGAGFGACVWVLTDHSLPATTIAAWLPLAAAIVVVVWLTGVVFGRFDPSVNTPA